MSEALTKLSEFLALYHPYYTVNDVALTQAKGYLCCLKPYKDGRYYTIDISGVGYPERDAFGRFISPYRLWDELHGILPTESEDEKNVNR